jgi:two-component sensor histidine kinase
MLLKFWKSISQIGVKEEFGQLEKKRIILTNQFSIVAILVFLLSGINNYFLGEVKSAIILECFSLLCVVVYFLHKYTNFKFTTSYLFIISSTGIFYFDSYSGFLSGTYLYHFPLILAIAFVFDLGQRKIILFHYLLPLTYLSINLLTHYSLFENTNISDSDRYQMFTFNLILSVASIGFFIYQTMLTNQKEILVYETRIEEREEAELKLKSSVQEKEILLAEIHHRVKNNMAVITSLLNLKVHSIDNKEVKEILLESRNRIKSMALIHDKLYKSGNVANIDFDWYTKELVSEIIDSFPLYNSEIKLTTKIEEIKLNVNNAIPCGLILNELLTNCYKHAFKDKKEGRIEIVFKQLDDSIYLRVEDNGSGFDPETVNSEALGMILIHSLSEQLDGKATFSFDNGTTFELIFKQQKIN